MYSFTVHLHKAHRQKNFKISSKMRPPKPLQEKYLEGVLPQIDIKTSKKHFEKRKN